MIKWKTVFEDAIAQSLGDDSVCIIISTDVVVFKV